MNIIPVHKGSLAGAVNSTTKGGGGANNKSDRGGMATTAITAFERILSRFVIN
jgi:hypothetical protein